MLSGTASGTTSATPGTGAGAGSATASGTSGTGTGAGSTARGRSRRGLRLGSAGAPAPAAGADDVAIGSGAGPTPGRAAADSWAVDSAVRISAVTGCATSCAHAGLLGRLVRDAVDDDVGQVGGDAAAEPHDRLRRRARSRSPRARSRSGTNRRRPAADRPRRVDGRIHGRRIHGRRVDGRRVDGWRVDRGRVDRGRIDGRRVGGGSTGGGSAGGSTGGGSTGGSTGGDVGGRDRPGADPRAGRRVAVGGVGASSAGSCSPGAVTGGGRRRTGGAGAPAAATGGAPGRGRPAGAGSAGGTAGAGPRRDPGRDRPRARRAGRRRAAGSGSAAGAPSPRRVGRSRQGGRRRREGVLGRRDRLGRRPDPGRRARRGGGRSRPGRSGGARAGRLAFLARRVGGRARTGTRRTGRLRPRWRRRWRRRPRRRRPRRPVPPTAAMPSPAAAPAPTAPPAAPAPAPAPPAPPPPWAPPAPAPAPAPSTPAVAVAAVPPPRTPSRIFAAAMAGSTGKKTPNRRRRSSCASAKAAQPSHPRRCAFMVRARRVRRSPSAMRLRTSRQASSRPRPKAARDTRASCRRWRASAAVVPSASPTAACDRPLISCSTRAERWRSGREAMSARSSRICSRTSTRSWTEPAIGSSRSVSSSTCGPGAHQVDALVVRDPEEPRPHGDPRARTRRQRPVGGEHRELEGLLRVLRVAHERRAVAEDLRAVALVEHLEGALVPAGDELGEGGVAQERDRSEPGPEVRGTRAGGDRCGQLSDLQEGDGVRLYRTCETPRGPTSAEARKSSSTPPRRRAEPLGRPYERPGHALRAPSFRSGRRDQAEPAVDAAPAPAGRSSMTRPQRRDRPGGELPPGLAMALLERLRPGEGRPRPGAAGHRVPRVGQGEDRGALGDLLAGQAVGVSAAVPALVVVADPGDLPPA